MSDRTPSPRPSFSRLAAISMFAFAIGMALNTVEPALLGQRIIDLAPERKNTALGFITAAGLVVAILTQPIAGALSDRTRSRWGRRLPYFVGGTGVVLLCLFTIALAPSLALVLMGVLAFQLGSNTVQGPWQALIPDLLPPGQRGLAAGLKTALEILSLIAGRGLSGHLVAAGNLVGAAGLAAAVFVVALIVTARTVREGAPNGDRPAPPPGLRALQEVFRIDWRSHPAFVWWFLNRALFWGGIIALSTFILFFFIDVAGMAQDQAQRFVGNFTLVFGVFLLPVALLAGWLADRWGRRPLMMGAGLLAAAAILLLLTASSPAVLYLTAGMIGLAAGVFLSASWALATDLVPPAEAARYLGIANIAGAGSSLLSRFAGGLLIDPLNRLAGNSYAGYLGLYALTIVGFLLSALAVARIPREVDRLAGQRRAGQGV